MSIQLGLGNGSFAAPALYQARNVRAVSTSMAVGDFDGDGKPDLAVGAHQYCPYNCYGPADVSVLLGNGDGTLKAPADNAPQSKVSGGPTWLIAGDIDGDGRSDLVVQGDQPAAFPNVAWLSDGDGHFRNVATRIAWAGYAGQALADLNGDGRLDFVSGGPFGLTAQPPSVSLGNGDGTFGWPMSLATPPAWQTRAVDLDGDGRLDLVSASGAAGVTVMLNVCAP